MKKVKITVLKTTFQDDLAREYGVDGLGPCPMHRAGDVYFGDYAKPAGLCDEAWRPSTSMCSRWPTARPKSCGTTGTG